MQFGVFVTPKIDDWQLIKYAEELGFHSAWVPDSQMIWSDCYATLALAAHNTSRIRLGTGVAIPGTRIAPVTAHSIASINRLAPGRVFLGIGTGNTAMRLMGRAPMRVRKFREYLRVVRALLRGEEVEYTLDGVTRATRFLHQDLGFLNLQDPIPIYVAANGPLALQTVGEFGDGLVSAFNEQPQVLQQNLHLVQTGADKVGRTLPPTFHPVTFTAAVVRQPGEKLTSERIIDEAGPWAASALHFVYEIFQQTKREEVIPAAFRGVWEEYCTHVEKMETPKEKRYLQIHNGHGTFVVITHEIFEIAPEALTRGRRLWYSSQRDDPPVGRTHCAADPYRTCGPSHRGDPSRAAVGGREPAAQGGIGERAAAAPDVPELLAAAVAGCEAQSRRETQA